MSVKASVAFEEVMATGGLGLMHNVIFITNEGNTKIVTMGISDLLKVSDYQYDYILNELSF